MEESRALPERQDFTTLYLSRKDFPKFTESAKFGTSGTLQIKGQISREEKQEKTIDKAIKITLLNGESMRVESKEDEDDDKENVLSAVEHNEPTLSIPQSSRDEFKDFHWGDKINLNSNYEVITVSDDTITLKLKNLTPKITRRV